MAETTPVTGLKAIPETIRERADYALKQLQDTEEQRSMRWQCKSEPTARGKITRYFSLDARAPSSKRGPKVEQGWSKKWAGAALEWTHTVTPTLMTIVIFGKESAA